MLLLVLAIGITIALTSCVKKVDFLTSTFVPAARGNVKIKKGDNNYIIKIKLSNLVEVIRLQPPKQVYVVWVVTDQKPAMNVGQFVSSSGFLSNKLGASFETTSTFKPTKIFITAEKKAGVNYPDKDIILSTNQF